MLENSLLKVFTSAYRGDPGLKIISRVYSGLQRMNSENTMNIKQKWEGEINGSISEETWKTYCEF